MNKRGKILFILVALIVIVFLTLGYYFWQQKQQKIQSGTSGVFGVAMIGPTCPGPQRVGQVCEKPYQGLIVIGTGEFKEVTRFETNSDGSFRVSLPPGVYTAKRQDNSAIFDLSKTPIQVEADKFSEVNILFDTGIR